MIEIQREVPIPPRGKKGCAEIQQALDILQPNDSFVVPIRSYKNSEAASRSIYAMARRRGFKIMVRNLPEGMRIWRTS